MFDFDNTLLHLNIDWGDFEKQLYSLLTINPKIIVQLDQMTLPAKLNYLSNFQNLRSVTLLLQDKFESECVTFDRYTLFPQIIQILLLAKKKGFRIAIVSANLTSTIKSILLRIGLLADVDLVVGRDTCAFTKPEKEPLVYVLNNLGVNPSEAVFIGDSINDEIASKFANVDFICIDPFASDLSKGKIKSILNL